MLDDAEGRLHCRLQRVDERGEAGLPYIGRRHVHLICWSQEAQAAGGGAGAAELIELRHEFRLCRLLGGGICIVRRVHRLLQRLSGRRQVLGRRLDLRDEIRVSLRASFAGCSGRRGVRTRSTGGGAQKQQEGRGEAEAGHVFGGHALHAR